MSIFALNITPYITSSIIMQLLTIAIPKLEEMHRDGEEGRKKIQGITRYLTVGLALFESLAMAIGFGNSGLIEEMNFLNVLTVVVALTAGSAFLMWVGERITENGVGNGISIVLMINILSRVPQDMSTLFETFVQGQTIAKGILAALIIIAVIVVTIVLVILLNDATRKIPVQYAKKMQGRRLVGGQASNIPLKVNTAGVIPVIFASSLMSIPQMVMAFIQSNPTGVPGTILGMLNQNNWFNFREPIYSVGLILYIVLIIFFAYFYTSITFNPIEGGGQYEEAGRVYPGYSSRQTHHRLSEQDSGIYRVYRSGWPDHRGADPIFFNGVFGASVSFGGTSIIIIVGVILETLKKIESQMLVRNYKGFLSE